MQYINLDTKSLVDSPVGQFEETLFEKVHSLNGVN